MKFVLCTYFVNYNDRLINQKTIVSLGSSTIYAVSYCGYICKLINKLSLCVEIINQIKIIIHFEEKFKIILECAR